MKKNKLLGLVLVLFGGFTIYWSQTHSPRAGLGQIIGNELSGSYTMNETQYFICLGLGIILCIMGLIRLVM